MMSERRHLVVLALTIVALLGFGFGVLKPRASEAADLRAQLTTAEAEELALIARLASLREAEADRGALEAAVQRVSAYLPPWPHLVRTVRLLHKASLKAGVDLRDIAPSQPSPSEALPGSRQINVSLVVKGRYDRVEAFTVQLEQLARAMKVTSITFAPAQEGNRSTLTASIQAIMYDYHPDRPENPDARGAATASGPSISGGDA